PRRASSARRPRAPPGQGVGTVGSRRLPVTMTPRDRRLAFLLFVLVAVAALAFWPRNSSSGSAREAAGRGSRGAAAPSAASRPGAASIAPDAVPTFVPPEPRSFGKDLDSRDLFHFVPPTPTRVPTSP